MKKTEYKRLLSKAPKDHMSPEFLQFLRDNNKIVKEGKNWLIIENIKYHTEKNPHHTAFYKPVGKTKSKRFLFVLLFLHHYKDWEWRKKKAEEQTVKRFHIHLIK